MRGKPKARSPLYDYIEDNLILQYGMPSLARKTLLQMIATCHQHYQAESRVRTFSELAGVVPGRFRLMAECRNEAQDFYFLSLTTMLNPRKIADLMSSQRTSHITIEQAMQHLLVIFGANTSTEMEDMMSGELNEICKTGKEGEIVGIDDLLEYCLHKWCQMAQTQSEQLLELFAVHDENSDGQLSIGEFSELIRDATPESSQHEIMALYKRCLEVSGRQAAATEAQGEEECEDAMDAILPQAFLSVVLPHYLSEMQRGMRNGRGLV